MAVELTSREVSERYDRFARWYDWIESVPDLLGVKRLRRSLLRRASGNVLEIAVGTGKNLAYYPLDRRIIAMDLSREMLKVAQGRAAKLSVDILFLVADAEALPFRSSSFDTVASSLSTCTFPNPLGSLKEMGRVCRSEGRVLLLEHGRSDREWLGHFQDRHADRFAKPLGCHWNREPLTLVREAGFKITAVSRFFLGTFHQIEAVPEMSE